MKLCDLIKVIQLGVFLSGSHIVIPTTAAPDAESGRHKVTGLTELISKVDAAYNFRINAASSISGSLPVDGTTMLLEFLERSSKLELFLSENELAAIKNDVAARLLVLNFLPDDFTPRFLAMVNAPEVGPIWQNYTVQFLDTLWKREASAEGRMEIYNTLVRCIRDSRLGIPATALLTLSRLPPEAGLSQRDLGNMAVRMLQEDNIAWQDKVTVLQVAAQAGDQRALSYARAYAVDAARPIMLKMSALATLGELGTGDDLQLVSRYAGSGEFRLRTAGRAAQKKIRERLKL